MLHARGSRSKEKGKLLFVLVTTGSAVDAVRVILFVLVRQSVLFGPGCLTPVTLAIKSARWAGTCLEA